MKILNQELKESSIEIILRSSLQLFFFRASIRFFICFTFLDTASRLEQTILQTIRFGDPAGFQRVTTLGVFRGAK